MKEFFIDNPYFKEPGTQTITIGEVEVPLPQMPPEKEMRNFDKPKLKQKFERRIIPDMWDWSEKDREYFIEQQWHRRFHGEWWLIKGQPFYFPGTALLFFDDWTLETGKKPDFRMEGLDFFTFWCQYVEPDPDLHGMFVMKCRRLGDTEKANCITWDVATKYRFAKCGMNSYTDEEVQKNFERLFFSHKNMPEFFRPIWKGSDNPGKELIFTKPPEKKTVNRYKDRKGQRPEKKEQFLESSIAYTATKNRAFDGRRLKQYHLDEIFKIKKSQMDVQKQIRNMRRVQSLHNGKKIVGKMLLTSTVENTEEKLDVETLEMAEKIWKESDPAVRLNNGRTKSGLVRYFRGFQHNAEVDEWGFHKVEEATRERDELIDEYEREGMVEELADLYRKEPGSPDEALNSMSDANVLHPQLCRKRLRQIKDNVNWIGEDMDRDGIPIRPKVIEGNLEWTNGFNSKVKFIPMKGGHWHVSQYPLEPNKVTMVKGMRCPNNTINYRMGADPFDADETIGQGSDGAFVVKRRYNPLHENRLQFDQDGEPLNIWDMETDQIVCDYKHRPVDPYHYYEAVYKTCIWYGTQVFPELDKAGLATWMRSKRLHLFLMFESKLLLADISSRSKPRQGTKATEQVVDRYIEALKGYVFRRIACTHHPRVIEQWAKFTRKRRGKLDLAVSSGFCELADIDGSTSEEIADDELADNEWEVYEEAY